MPENNIFKIENFVNREGKQVTSFTRTDANSSERFSGSVMVVMRGPNGQEASPKKYDFGFPPSVTSLEQAFDEFDSTWKASMEEDRREYEKAKQENRKKIVLPNGQQAPEAQPELTFVRE